MRCAGCKHAFYCSKFCQKQAWNKPDGHKKVCKLLVERAYPLLSPSRVHERFLVDFLDFDLRRNDLHLLRSLALGEVMRHVRPLLRRAKQKYPKHRPEDLEIFVSFLSLPVVVDVVPVRGAEDEAPRRRERRPNLVRAIYPSGTDMKEVIIEQSGMFLAEDGVHGCGTDPQRFLDERGRARTPERRASVTDDGRPLKGEYDVTDEFIRVVRAAHRTALQMGGDGIFEFDQGRMFIATTASIIEKYF